MPEEKKFYITTPIFYANAELHLGHTYTLVLSDIIARYHRARGEWVFFLSGADEHGDKIVRAAQKEGVGPQAFVNKNVASFQELMKSLDISNDAFIRTSDREQHWPGAMRLWRAVEEAGDIYKDTYEGLYCVGCEAFITEKELVNGKCVHHDAPPEHISEENYFFKFSRYVPELRRLLENDEIIIVPPQRKNEMLALLSEGEGGCTSTVGNVSISRPERAIPWGIPVPDDPGQLMYVWCDALSNYISALGYGSVNDSNFKTFWPADIHVLGKDIVRFHALLWPALLLSAKLPLPRELLVHGFVTSGGKKMSKTLGNVLKPYDFISEYGAEALRYYLAREVVPTEDWDLTAEKFKEVYNANLANGLGNLVSRTVTMANQYFGGVVAGNSVDVPPIQHKQSEREIGFEPALAGCTIPYFLLNEILPRYHAHMRANEINRAMDVVWELIGELDQFISFYEPFKLVKTDKPATERVIWSLLFGLREVASMLAPVMPKTAGAIADIVGTKQDGEVVTYTVKPLSAPLFPRKQ